MGRRLHSEGNPTVLVGLLAGFITSNTSPQMERGNSSTDQDIFGTIRLKVQMWKFLEVDFLHIGQRKLAHLVGPAEK
jgi:hypothetical protein